jgi:hypothetical protein
VAHPESVRDSASKVASNSNKNDMKEVMKTLDYAELEKSKHLTIDSCVDDDDLDINKLKRIQKSLVVIEGNMVTYKTLSVTIFLVLLTF